MATYTTEQLLTSVLSTEFYSAKTIDNAISALSGEIGDIVDAISVEINPKLGEIADAVSAHVQEINDLSTTVDGLTGLTAMADLSDDIEDLTAINAQLTGITPLATDGSASIISVIVKVNEILTKFTKQA